MRKGGADRQRGRERERKRGKEGGRRKGEKSSWQELSAPGLGQGLNLVWHCF